MPVHYELRDRVARITIDNAEKGNILDKQHSNEISEAWIRAWEDREARSVLLTATGDRHFCAGHNLAPPPGVSAEDREFLRAQWEFWPQAGTVNGQKFGLDGRFGDHYPRIWKPVVAAVNGWAAGAGLYLLLASTDIRVACAEHARFKFALLSQGWIGHGPGATLLARQLRYADAMKMLLTDEPVDAAEAFRMGLVNEVVPHETFQARAEEIALQCASMPPVASRMMKEFAVRYREAPEDIAWQVQTLMNHALINGTTDGVEGRKAFNDKRAPEWTGGLRRAGAPFEEPSPEDWERLDRLRKDGIR